MCAPVPSLPPSCCTAPAKQRFMLEVCDTYVVFLSLSKPNPETLFLHKLEFSTWGLDNRSAEEDTKNRACASESHMSVASLMQENPKSLLRGTLLVVRGRWSSNLLALRMLVLEQLFWEAG